YKIEGAEVTLMEDDSCDRAGTDDDEKETAVTNKDGVFSLKGEDNEYLSKEECKHKFYINLKWPCYAAKKCDNKKFREECHGFANGDFYTTRIDIPNEYRFEDEKERRTF
ncbi:hypothetical protein PMAYCL1PPCAC_25280, partial [Pristionchus mayeri]